MIWKSKIYLDCVRSVKLSVCELRFFQENIEHWQPVGTSIKIPGSNRLSDAFRQAESA